MPFKLFLKLYTYDLNMKIHTIIINTCVADMVTLTFDYRF